MTAQNNTSLITHLLGALLTLGAAGIGQAATGAWTGAQDAYWTNSANWTAGGFPSGGETASFTNAGNAQTTINVAGLSAISNIVFDTADVAAYTVGAAGVNQQTLTLPNSGLFRLTASAANSALFHAAVTLGADRNTGTYTVRNDNTARTLTFAGNVAGSAAGATAGAKTLTVDGAGNTLFLGNVTPGGASSLSLSDNSTGTLTLSGTNTLQALTMNGAGGVIDIGAGQTTFTGGGGNNLIATQDATINGTGSLVLSTGGGENYADNAAASGKTLTINVRLTGSSGFEYWSDTRFGTIVLAGQNDFATNVIMNAAGTISVGSIGNQGSTTSNLGRGQRIIFNSTYGGASRLLYTGAGETSDRLIEFRQNGIIEQGGSGNLKFTTALVAGSQTCTLQGSTAGTGEIAGTIPGSLTLVKGGSGTWYLSGANTFSGATLVTNGTLALRGSLGALGGTSGLTVTNGAVFRIDNTASANNTNRLRDAASITLNGGTLSFAHDGSAADFLENAGALIINQNAGTVSVAQAPAGQKATLRFASLSRSGSGTVNFTGTGLGESDRCRVFIAGQAPGLLGSWVSVNGTAGAAYDSVQGVYLPGGITTTDIAAKGPSSVIPDDPSATARINLPGEDGPITLAGAWSNSIYTVVQNTPTNAVIATRDGTTNKTLQTAGILINAGMASVTVGEGAGDGALAPLSAGGSVLLQNDEPSSALTVNAPLVNSGAPTALTKGGAGPVALNASNDYSGATAILEGELRFGGSVTQQLSSTISGAGSLVKQGSGRLVISGTNTFTGVTKLSEGTVVAQSSFAFGGTASGTVIEPGATLDLGSSLPVDGLNLGTELFTVSGAGVDGKGAIVNNGPNRHFNAFGRIALASNTTFGGVSRWDLRQNAPSLALNGHTLTKVGSSEVVLVGTAVTPGAGSIDVVSGSFQIETSTKLNGGVTNTMRIRTGARLGYYILDAAANATPWSLLLDDRSTVVSFLGTPAQNIWSGPVSLNGTAFLDGGAGNTLSFSGPVTNTGSFVKIGAGAAYLTGSNNTYSGGSFVSNGMLYAKFPGSLPGWDSGSNLTVAAGGTIMVPAFTGSYGWTTEQIRTLHDTNRFGFADASLGIETSGNLDYPHAFPVPMGLAKQGNGTLNIPDGQALISQIRANGGELVLDNLSVNVSNKTCVIGDLAADFGKLTLAGTALWYSHTPGKSDTSAPLLLVGNSGRGVLAVKDSAVLTNRMNVGNNGGSHGAVYQSGGAVVNWGGSATDARLGQNGYGYYELSGGDLVYKGWSQIGGNLSGVGILKVSGGSFTQRTDFDGNLGLSRGGTGVVHVTSGTFTTLSELWVGDSNENSTSGGYADFTLAGGLAAVGGSVKMADRNNMRATVSLNGGVLEANQIYRAVRSNSPATVAFNGGTFRARTGGALFGTGAAAPDAVSIYAGGATFDTTNFNVSVSVPLRAPQGQGVASVALAPRGGYIGPPFVTFIGGGGTGATAIAQFDSASGFVNGIMVTCPGFGYTSAPAVALSGGGTNIHLAATASLGGSASGGLTKLGDGLLLLNATNTYGGATTVSNGTLRLGVAGAFPGSGAVSVAGGTFDLGGFDLTAGALSASGGAIINGSLNCSSMSKGGSGVLTLAAQLATPAPITVSGGTLRLQGVQPGLYEAPVAGAFNTTESMSTSIVMRLTTRMANMVYTEPYNTTWIYKGYLWNRASTNVTWTFGENFDDSVLLMIDGATLIGSGNGWDTPTIATATLTPGAHVFEARFGQGGGGAGPVNSRWWTTTAFGFGIDYFGRNATNIANFVALTDPGDGSLLTLTAAGSSSNVIGAAASVVLGEGALLDLGGTSQTLAGLSGSGTVSNGALAVTGALAPAGTNVIGALSLSGVSPLAGTLLVDVASGGSSDVLSVQGNIDLSSLALEIANPGQLNRQKAYTVLTCTGTRSGAFSSVTVPDSRWRVLYRADGSVQLIFVDGTLLKVR